MPIVHLNLVRGGNFYETFKNIWEGLENMTESMRSMQEKLAKDQSSSRTRNFSFVTARMRNSIVRGGSNEAVKKPGGYGMPLQRKASRNAYSSASQLVSGDNVRGNSEKNFANRQSLVKGVRRTQSYHWN